jgi:hypothetical protein
MTDAAARGVNDTGAGPQAPGPRVSVPGRGGDGRGQTLPAGARGRLVNVLLAKAAVDLLFVCALAAGFHYAAFRPSFRGSLDHADAHSVRGWVLDKSEPGRRVEVQLYLDGRLAASAEASEPRPDVAAKGYAPDERHGFVFALGALTPGEHEARVYAVHASDGGRRRTLQQIGGAMKFSVREER